VQAISARVDSIGDKSDKLLENNFDKHRYSSIRRKNNNSLFISNFF
jgi:hypothetical protein